MDNGATLGVGSDCYPYTILTQTDRKITCQRDNFKPGEGYDYYSNQVYVFTPNPSATIETYTFRKNGKWIKQGDSLNGCRLYPGNRRAYRDPCF